MRYRDQALANSIHSSLNEYSAEYPLPGIYNTSFRNCFVAQLVDSVRRVSFYTTVASRTLSAERINPTSQIFDPIRAAMLSKQNQNYNEAYWLAFLAVHFGRNNKTQWELVRNVYGGLGNSRIWTWDAVTNNFQDFSDWMEDNEQELARTGNFGNHRKYESLKSASRSGTVHVINSYLNWIGDDHISKFEAFVNRSPEDPRQIFDFLYGSMRQVYRFGRTARFDYLTSIGKLNLIQIEPGRTYLQDATGPVRGSRLLFGGGSTANISKPDLEELLNLLESKLNLPFGMQVLEDALCNWQKSPGIYKYFNG